MQATLHSDDGATVQIDVVLTDGTQLYLTEDAEGVFLRVRKMAGVGTPLQDAIVVQPVCSNVIEVG